MEFISKTPVGCSLLLIMTFILIDVSGQVNSRMIYRQSDFENKTDSLRKVHNNSVFPAGDPLETAIYLALSHYPELAGHRIKIKYKKNVRHPVTASWSFRNLFKFRKRHI